MPKAPKKIVSPSLQPDQSPERPAASRGIRVTYRPINVTDPNVTRWNGVMFQANIPVMLDPAKHFVLQPYNEIVELNGNNKSIERERKISMIELAKGNPSFEVEGFPRAKVKKSQRVVPPVGADWADANEDEIITDVEWPEDVAA